MSSMSIVLIVHPALVYHVQARLLRQVLVLYWTENSYRLQFVAQMRSAKLERDTRHDANLVVLEYAQSRLDSEKEKAALQTTMFCKV